MSSYTSAQRSRRAGVIILLALGMTMIMSWLAIEILSSVRKELSIKTAPKDSTQLRQAAYQMLELSIGVVAEIDQFEGGIYTPNQGWGIPLPYAGIEDSAELERAFTEEAYTESFIPEDEFEGFAEEEMEGDPLADDTEGDDLLAELMDDSGEEEASGNNGFNRAVTLISPPENSSQLGPDTTSLSLPKGLQARVRLYDESGKLSLTATRPERWLLFFEEMGFEESECKQLTDCLLDWMDPDDIEREDGAESEVYGQEEPPYKPANRPLRDFMELRLVDQFKVLFFDERGLPNNYYSVFARNVSLVHTDDVNINTASDIVLRTLAEERNFDEESVLNFLAGSDLEFGTDDDRILEPGVSGTDMPNDENGEPITGFRKIRYIQAEIAVSAGQTIFYLNALLDLQQKHPGGVYPYRILRVAENQPLS